MNGPESLVEFHRRCHQSFSRLLDHGESLTEEELHRKLEGFGYPTVQLQIHHVIAAERYWLGVLQGRIDVDEDEDQYPDISRLKRFREETAGECERYLRGSSSAELSEPRELITWGGQRKVLVPAHVMIRTQVHIFHHQGQILAMCRLLGKPANGFDYPMES
jgi:uncharacterized damage-inducible protein DinB